MRAVSYSIALALLVVACSKDEELTDSAAAPLVDSTSSAITVDDVAGSYYGLYTSWSTSEFPPPNGSSSYFSDIMFIQVRPDSTNPYTSDWIYIRNQTYTLHADSTLSCAGTAQSSSCDGRFYWFNDTLRLECEFYDHMDYSSSGSSFTGFRQ